MRECFSLVVDLVAIVLTLEISVADLRLSDPACTMKRSGLDDSEKDPSPHIVRRENFQSAYLTAFRCEGGERPRVIQA